MTTEYSVHVNDWSDERWNHVGVNLMYEHYLEDEDVKKEVEEDYPHMDVEEFAREKADGHFPMMLYAYPLAIEPSDDAIREVCRETCCTVVEDEESGDYYLALSGGGMDLSQNVALAYMIAEKWIPTALASEVSTQYGLNFSGETYLRVMNGLKESLQKDVNNITYQLSRIEEGIEKAGYEITKSIS